MDIKTILTQMPQLNLLLSLRPLVTVNIKVILKVILKVLFKCYFSDKAKPFERKGRKASSLSQTVGLPKKPIYCLSSTKE